MSLNAKNKKFLNEYFKNGGNATQAYLKYYRCTERSAAASASAIIRREDAREYLAKLEDREVEVVAEEKVYDERDALVAETRIADVNVIDVFDENGDVKMPKDWPLEIQKSIKAIEMDHYEIIEENSDGTKTITRKPYVKKITFNRRGGALDRLEKCFGMQREKIEHSGQIDIRAILARIDGLNKGRLPQDCS